MNQVRGQSSAFGDRLREVGEARRADEREGVLRVPPFHSRVGPNLVPNAVERFEAALPEQIDPVARPLLINMVCSTLPGNRRGEDDDIAEPAEVRNETRSAAGREVLGDLEARHEVVPTVESKLLLEIVCAEGLPRNQQGSVGTRFVSIPKTSQPSSASAINHAPIPQPTSSTVLEGNRRRMRGTVSRAERVAPCSRRR